MRKLREAAVVAAMVGSVSMLGAGVASAYGGEEQELPTVNCVQDADSNSATITFAGTLVPVTTGDAGDADASATQQICGVGNEENENTAGDATGGTGTSVAGGGGGGGGGNN
ncbi:hypothetical protein [Streptomyces albidus (ex Kaewkla and Franco 2022)]|uniref:hypothetical protein n=1 Tax=Streptomyces albidus (ex Kaewkla and Franco 2022) TaxID=722709 RepID=UPI0015EF1C39|nr:hypothetical protein [Streptomyces albidus (ex Kaewkla and Franco 2022)]